MGDDARGELHVAEDDVLDAGTHVALAAGLQLGRPLADEIEQDGDVVRTEAPERVLVGADHAEVHAHAVQVAQLAELTGVDQGLDLAQPRVEEQEVSDHQTAIGSLGGLDQLACLGRRERERLLDEQVLAGREHAHPERVVGRHGGGDRDGVDGVVCEHLVELVWSCAPRDTAGGSGRGSPRRDRRPTRARPPAPGCAPGSAPSSRGRRRRGAAARSQADHLGLGTRARAGSRCGSRRRSAPARPRVA